jgi:hypothetical protein
VVLAVVVVAPVREAVDVVLVVEALWAGERRRERRRESARVGNFIVVGLMIGLLGSSLFHRGAKSLSSTNQSFAAST